MSNTDWITTEEAADRCGVTTRTIRNWAQGGKIPAKRLPERGLPYVFRLEDVDRFVEEQGFVRREDIGLPEKETV